MKHISFIWISLLSFGITACSSDVNTFAKKITAKGLRKHLEIIASDSMQGREMATEGERKASSYIAKNFKNLGLLPAPGTHEYLQGFDVVKDSIDEAMFWVGTKSFSLKTFGRIEPAINSNADISADAIIFAGYGIDTSVYNDYKNIDVRGKVILICNGEPKKSTTASSARPSG